MKVKEILAIPFYAWELGAANLILIILVAIVALLKGA